MSGLSSVSDNNGTYLSIAGGFIWNRKADKSDPDYAEQTFVRVDKTEGVRAGARYADLTGTVTKVEFKTHPEYGESINVTFIAGKKEYIISISTNNRYSQDMMKCLLVMDLDKELFMKPYDFVGDDKRRAMGISFRQDGTKLNLRVDDAPTKEKDWFKNAEKKAIRRFFEDLTEWFVAEVETVVAPKLAGKTPPVASQDEEEENYQEEYQEDETTEESAKEKAEPVKEKAKPAESKVSPLKMKKALKAYIDENYEGKSLPKLSKEDLEKWYNLSLQVEELPFEDEVEDNKASEVDSKELEDQLNMLMK